MRRFAYSFAVGLVGVVALGGLLLVVAEGGMSAAPSTAAGALLGQTEDEQRASEDGTAAPVPVLSPVEQLLAQLVSPSEGTGLPAAQRVLLSRDPFAPVVPDTAAGDSGEGDGTGDGGTGDSGGGTDGSATDGSATDGDTPTDGGSNTDGDGAGDSEVCDGNESETVCDGVVVTLDAISQTGAAVVTVDGTSYTVSEGDEFATSFRVLAINPPCVTLLYGDEAFSICDGATVLK